MFRVKMTHTQAWPCPPWLHQSNPRLFDHHGAGKILSNVVIEDSQTTIVRLTSVGRGEPVNSLVFVHPVARRVHLKRVVTSFARHRQRTYDC